MKDIGYLALIVMLLLVIKSDYNDTANKTYSLLTKPVILYYENNTLGFSNVTIQDNAGHRIHLPFITSLANRIGNDYNIGDTIDIKPMFDYNYTK